MPCRSATTRAQITSWVGTATDIHDRKLIEEQRTFIVTASDTLSRSLDYRETLTQVAELAANGEVADWCAVHVVETDGTLSEVAVAHADPAKVTLARELQERYPPDPNGPTGVPAVIRTGEAELVPEVTKELIESVTLDDLHRELIDQLEISSYMCVPLKGRDRVLGAMTFISSSERHFGAGRADLRGGARAPRGKRDRERAALSRDGGSRTGGPRARGDRRRRGAHRPRRPRPALEPRGRADHGTCGRDVLGPQRPRRDPRLGGRGAAAPDSAGRARPAAPRACPSRSASRELWLSISAVGYEDGTVYAFRDLTEERALESMRQDFVATVSHELRTPLAAIYGAALTLRREDVELEEQLKEKLLEVITEESSRLAEIVSDLLLASQLDTGKLYGEHRGSAIRARSRSSSSTQRRRICRRTSSSHSRRRRGCPRSSRIRASCARCSRT